jgi:putative ABC transport system permease protein
MIGLAIRSLRHRATAFTATFVSVLLGTALMGSFATLLETSTGPVSGPDEETLFIMGAVVGGWGTLIVLFSLASTLSVTVRQRDVEIALLRTVGTTPRQARRMIRMETLVVAAAGSALGAVVAWFGGRALLGMIRNGGMVSDSVEYGGGPTSLGITAVAIIVTSMLSATIAGRKATSGRATMALSDSGTDQGRMRWWRVLGAFVLIAYGIGTAVLTIVVMADSDDPYAAMQSSGAACILVGVGFAQLAPVLLSWLSAPLRTIVGNAGAAGHLAAFNTSRRAHLMSAVLGPVIVFTASTIGILMLVGIDGRTLSTPEGLEAVNTLNNVVVGMIAVFAAIMVVNAFAAVISQRRTELARLRLLGATTEQVRRSVLAEAGLIAAVGVVLGVIASLATIVPFAIARDEGVVPDGQLWLPVVLVLVAVGLTVGSAGSAVSRVTSKGAGMLAAASGTRQ